MRRCGQSALVGVGLLTSVMMPAIVLEAGQEVGQQERGEHGDLRSPYLSLR